MKKFSLSLVIFGRYFTWNLDDVKEGITHRHYGLYTNLSKIFLKLNRQVFWYSYDKRSLVSIAGSAKNPDIDPKRVGPLRSLFRVVKECLNNGSVPAVIFNYPHTFQGIGHLLEYLSMLVLLRFLKTAIGIPILIDNMDPPIEHREYLGKKGLKNSLRKSLFYLLEPLALKDNNVILLTESWKKYYIKKFGIKPQNISIIPCGSFPEAFDKVAETKIKNSSEGLTVFYAGTASERYNVDELVDAIDETSDEGLNIKLIIAGDDKIRIKSRNVEIPNINEFKDYSDELARSDVAVVPLTGSYPSCTSLAKVGDYMLAGLPVISLPLFETSKVIEEGKCGYIVRNFEELKMALGDLSGKKKTVSKLSHRAREYAEANMDYAKFAKNLFKEIKCLAKEEFESYD